MSVLAGFMVPHPPMIVPDIGRGGEKEIQDTIDAYERVADEVAALCPETIVIISPHSVMYADYFHLSPGSKATGSFAAFRATRVRFSENYDEEMVNTICSLADAESFPAGTMGEQDPELDHGTMVPLWFIRNKYKGGRIVRVGLSGLPLTDHYRLGQLIKKAVNNLGRKTVIVASGDLSHKLQHHGPYGFIEEGPEYDERIMDVMGRAAFGELFNFDESFCSKAAECGHRSFVIMAGTFDGVEVKAERLSHQDVTGVGYGICTFYPVQTESENGPDSAGVIAEDRCFLDMRLNQTSREPEDKYAASDEYVKLAYASVEAYVARREVLCLSEIEADDRIKLTPEMLDTRAGAFVSIHEHGALRGCIGTIWPTKSCLAVEIIANAISAATRDPRFPAITEDELPWLEINVDVLGEPEDIDSKEKLDVNRYGVIVTSGNKRGLLLPDLDGIDTVDRQIEIAKQKAGIGNSEDYSLQRFEVIRHY